MTASGANIALLKADDTHDDMPEMLPIKQGCKHYR